MRSAICQSYAKYYFNFLFFYYIHYNIYSSIDLNKPRSHIYRTNSDSAIHQAHQVLGQSNLQNDIIPLGVDGLNFVDNLNPSIFQNELHQVIVLKFMNFFRKNYFIHIFFISPATRTTNHRTEFARRRPRNQYISYQRWNRFRRSYTNIEFYRFITRLDKPPYSFTPQYAHRPRKPTRELCLFSTESEPNSSYSTTTRISS